MFPLLLGPKQCAEVCARIILAHERLAHQESVDVGLSHCGHILHTVNTAFGHEQRVVRHLRRQRQCGPKRSIKGAQIAVVDPKQGGRQRERSVQFFTVS